MFALGPLSFAAPMALFGLFALPILWRILRATPPAPKRAVFPPLRLLFGAPDDAETPHHAPWWLIALRLLIAALVIIALARPVWTPPSAVEETRPLLLVIDDGWASAPSWDPLRREARRRLDQAEQDGRLAAMTLTAATENMALQLDAPNTARRRLDAAEPLGWAPDRAAAAERITAARDRGDLPGSLAVVWLSDGVATDGARALSRALSAFGEVRIITPDSGREALALAPPEAVTDGLQLEIRRAGRDLPRDFTVSAFDSEGRALARSEGVFAAGEGAATVDISLPLDLRNRIASLRVDGSASAGGTRLMGDRWRRPRVGLIEPAGEDTQPLLSDLHYIASALNGRAEVSRAGLDALLEASPAALVMIDAARSDDSRISDFVAEGGLLIRFAGSRLAARGDDLVPVQLREGGRLFGGALNWDEPQTIAPFAPDTPFAGLPVDPTAAVRRQVLAEPGAARPDRVWARLEDGTPLVTAERRGRGWIVLFHVTASPDWSDLPLSGLFPRLLERTLGLAQGAPSAGPASGAWAIDRALDGEGRLTDPPASARPIPAEALEASRASAEHPAGLYRLGAATAALNAIETDTEITPLPADLPGAVFEGLDGPRPIAFIGAMLAIALFLLTVDVVVALGLAGRLPTIGRGAATAAIAALLVLHAWPEAAHAQPPAPDAGASGETLTGADAFAMNASLELRFAYVETGDAAIDARSRAGLFGLSRETYRRSAVEPTDPMAINIERDPILFFPMIYWPVREDAQPLSPEAAERVSAYLQGGGLIVFDTQDADIAALRAGAPHPGLVALLESIDVPPLAQIPPDHTLTRTFFLLQEFPGRYSGAPVWVEADPQGAARDGTSGVVIGAHDWAAAWAVGEDGRPTTPIDGDDRQREMARRFGVNLAMYALTGNYKADQVHVPALLERLGQ